MEVLKSGNEKNKARISYRLIDVKNKNSVNVKEFKEFLADYFRSWTSITNSMVTPEIK
jgi:TolB-like protein